VTDFVEMFRHWNAGRSQVQINEALSVEPCASLSSSTPV
jgi:hypothetical protein